MDGKIPVQPEDRVPPDKQPDQIQHNEANGEREFQEIAAIYVGLADLNSGLSAVFVNNSSNAERKMKSASTCFAYAISVSSSYISSNNKFIYGVPYRFRTLLRLPDDDVILPITCRLREVVPILPNVKFSGKLPSIRGSFTRSDGDFIIFEPCELPPVKFNGRPLIRVFQDQVSKFPHFRMQRDCLLKTRTGMNVKGRPFTCVEDIKSTFHLSKFSSVPIRDTPSPEFTKSVCEKFRIQLLIGGEDSPDLPCPCITNLDIMDMGDVFGITNFNEFFSFAKSKLESKLSVATISDSVRRKITSFIENEGIRDTARHTLIWANLHEGLLTDAAHHLLKILNQSECRPLVITAANGLTMCVPDDCPLDVNPETFPPLLYAQVSVISGCVSVFNDTLNGRKKTNRGSGNTVRYLVGYPHPKPKRAFEINAILPPTIIAEGIAGAVSNPVADGSDDYHISPISMVAIVQARKVKGLTAELDFLRNCSFEVLRATTPGRWTSIFIRPLQSDDNENLKKLLSAEHVFYYPVSLITRPSNSSGVGLLKTNPAWSYQKGTPIHLDYIAKYRWGAEKKEKPIFFPASDSFVKIIFPDDSYFPDFIEFLKDANRRVENTWFSALRCGGVDHNLFIGKDFAHKPLPKQKEKSGNFIIIEGLHLGTNTNSLVRQINNIVEVKRSFWGRSFDYQHRFIIETITPLEDREGWKSLIPEKIFGVNVDICLAGSVEEWGSLQGHVDGPLKFLNDTAPELQGVLKDLFNETNIKFNIEPLGDKGKDKVASKPPEKKQVSDPAIDQTPALAKKATPSPRRGVVAKVSTESISSSDKSKEGMSPARAPNKKVRFEKQHKEKPSERPSSSSVPLDERKRERSASPSPTAPKEGPPASPLKEGSFTENSSWYISSSGDDVEERDGEGELVSPSDTSNNEFVPATPPPWPGSRQGGVSRHHAPLKEGEERQGKWQGRWQ